MPENVTDDACGRVTLVAERTKPDRAVVATRAAVTTTPGRLRTILRKSITFNGSSSHGAWRVLRSDAHRSLGAGTRLIYFVARSRRSGATRGSYIGQNEPCQSDGAPRASRA